MKKFFLVAMVMVAVVCGAGQALAEDKIGEISAVKRIVQGDDNIQIMAIDDPDNLFITCYLTSISTGKIFAMADPSNNSISCRQVQPVPMKDGRPVVDTSVKENIFSMSKSVLFKEMKIARHYDAKRKVLTYTAYVNKMIGGSLKHSLSVVPLSF